MFTFKFLCDKIDQNTNFAKLLSEKMAFFDMNVNVIPEVSWVRSLLEGTVGFSSPF